MNRKKRMKEEMLRIVLFISFMASMFILTSVISYASERISTRESVVLVSNWVELTIFWVVTGGLIIFGMSISACVERKRPGTLRFVLHN